MEADYVVIKVKYGDMLRRFNARAVDADLDIHIDGLRKKIISLFSFPLDAELMLTYIDEDGDIVTLADDDDLCDVVKQALNPIRITVKLIEGKKCDQKKRSSGISSHELSQIQQPQQNLNSDVLKCLSNVPEPIRETFLKLSADLASKASSASPDITQMAELFSRVCSSYLGQPSVIQPEMHSTKEAGVSESSKPSTKTNYLVDSDRATAMTAFLKIASKDQQTISMQSLEKPKSEENIETNDAKFDVSGDESEGLPSKAFNLGAVAAALKSPDVDASSQGSTLTHPKVNPVSGVAKKGKLQKEKTRRILGSYVSRRKHHLIPNHVPASNKHWSVEKSDGNPLLSYNFPAGLHGMAIEKETNNMPTDPKLAPNPDSGSVSNPPSRGYLGCRVKSPKPFQTSDTVGPIIPEFSPGPIAKNDTSFSASSVQNVSTISPHPVPQPSSLARSTRLHNGIHIGVDCDGCGLYPITGPRFKSKVKVGYYLCDICFQEIGNQTDYTRFEGSIGSPYQMYLKDLIDAPAKGSSTLPNACMGSKVKQAESKLDSRFVLDVNISDGISMPPLVAFTKIWRLRNSGTVAWSQKSQLVWVGGDKLSDVLSFEINVPATGLMKDQELDVAVDLITPELPGRYISYWRLASPTGQKFGQRVWVLIQVLAPTEKTPLEVDGGFNLNLPPVSSYRTTNPETTNINREMTTESIKLGPNITKKPGERFESKVSFEQKTEPKLKFPMIDSLLAGNGASNFRPPSTSSASYPIVNLSDLTPPPPPPPPLYTAPSDNSFAIPQIPMGTTQFDAMEHDVESLEDSVLRQLMEMGFNNVALNREVSMLSGYNLAIAVRILTDYGFP